MYPISDLTTFCRKTLGDVPPKLVGASTTVVGSKIYLYGGRLVAERRMVTDIYMFDMETFTWEKLAQSPDSDQPRARYFHSTDAWNNNLIVFGGMALQSDSPNPEELCVLNDVRFFNLTTKRWLPPSTGTPPELAPKARYAHLSSVTSNRLFIIGGQDLSNVWLDDIYVFDLRTQTWTQRREYPRHCGTYRSVAVSSNLTVRFPQEEINNGSHTSNLGPSGTRFSRNPSTTKEFTAQDALIHLPYSAAPTDDYPSEIYLFSNYNFTNVQRELEVFSPTSGSDFTISDRSLSMTGTSFPPGLRFPTGAILGTHFIVAGTYLTQSYQSFSIWALDLVSMTWSRIDPGSALASGSWFRSCLWSEVNKLIIFGNANGNLASDYNRRLLSWDHVACIDLEAFGIYQCPKLYMPIEEQQLGLAALEEGVMTDFDILCDDGRKIAVSRKILEERWPWFKQQRNLFLQNAARVVNTLQPAAGAGADVPLPELASLSKEPRADPRLSSRLLNLSESYPISLALVQYFYTKALITPLQHAPAVLSQLLLLSSTYNLSHLQSLVKHAMHRALTYATSVGIYGVSTLCNCRSLQIRALRVVMAYSQKRPARRTRDREDGGSRDGTGGGVIDSAAARPRGMSDASFMQRTPADSYGNGTMKNGGGSSSDNVDHHNRKGTNKNTRKGSTSVPISPLSSVARSSLAEAPLMTSTFPDDDKDPLLLYWADDGLSSPFQSPLLTKYSAQNTVRVSPITPASNTSFRSPPKSDFGHQDPRGPSTSTNRNPSVNGGPVTSLHKRRFSVDPLRENTNYAKAGGLLYDEDTAEVGLDGSIEMEIDDLLEELMDSHSKRRVTMTPAPLLPLPEEFSPTDGHIYSQPHFEPSLSPLPIANLLYYGDSDTPSLVSSSPTSSRDSHLLSASPSLKPKRSYTPITPSTDGWGSPPTLAVVPERKPSSPDYFGYTKVPRHPEVYPPDLHQVPEDVTRDSYLCGSRDDRGTYSVVRAHHSNLPPLRTTIPEDSTIHRRGKKSISSQHTITTDYSRRAESPINHSMSSYFSDDAASEITEIGYSDPGLEPAYLSTPSVVPPHPTRPRPLVEVSRGSGSGSFNNRHSPRSGASLGSMEYPPPSNHRHTQTPKRGMLQSFFGQNEQKKERKQGKEQDHIQIQSPVTQPMDAVSFITTSSKSSKGKADKAEKAAKREQLAMQLKAKQLQQAAEKASRVTGVKKSAPKWEESGGMFSVDSFL